MAPSENQLRDQMAELGKSLYDRGLAHGSAGNISVKLADGYLLSPTNSCLGRLDPAKISRLDGNGKLVSGDAPSKEAFLHLGMYGERPTSAPHRGADRGYDQCVPHRHYRRPASGSARSPAHCSSPAW